MPSDEQIDPQRKLIMPSDELIDQQLALLETYRRNLALYLRQQASLGESYIPPGVFNGIHEVRDNIQRIKNTLRDWNVSIEDHPDDEWPGSPASKTELHQSNGSFPSERGDSTTRQEPSERLLGATKSGLGATESHPSPQSTDIVHGAPGMVNNMDLYVTISGQEVWVRTDPAQDVESEPFMLKIDLQDFPETFDTLAEWKEKVFTGLIGKGILKPNSPDDQRLRELGQFLFEGLFPNNPEPGKGWHYYRERADKAKTNGPLRIWLNVPSELEMIPWELLRCPVNNFWLSTDTSRSLVRTLPPNECKDLPHHWSRGDDPLRIVVVMAGPEQDPLAPSLKDELNRHKQHLQDCYATLERGEEDVIIDYIEGTGTYQQLIARLSRPEPMHVLHIFCHGELIGDEAVLQFVKEASDQNNKHGDRDPVRGSSLREHMRQRFTSFPNEPIQFVILNACFSANTTRGGLLKSLAAELVQEGVPAVIAMQGKVEPNVVHELTRTLYESLWNAESINHALTKARRQLYESYISTLEWATPVLFLHPKAKDKALRLFEQAPLRTDPRPPIGVSPWKFLEVHGLGTSTNNHGFFSVSADIEHDRLRKTFVLGPLRLVSGGAYGTNPRTVPETMNQLNEPKSLFLFASHGYGKTSYCIRMELFAEENPKNQPLIIRFNFARSIIASRRRNIDLLQIIKRKTFDALKLKFKQDSTRREEMRQNEEARFHFMLLEQEFDSKTTSRGKRDAELSAEWIEYLSQIACHSNFNGICFLFEDLDKLESDSQIAFDLLKPLITAPLLNIPNFGFKFFLLNDFEPLVLAKLGDDKDVVKIYHLNSWEDTQLHNMLRGRLYHYYNLGTKEAPADSITQFSHFCDGFDVDMRLIKAAKGSPRKLIGLMRDIIDTHCATISDPRTLISKDTIDKLLRPHER